MNPTAPETGRITLTLSAGSIRALRMLAVLKRASQNAVAEFYLTQGGLHTALAKALGEQQFKKPAAEPAQAPSMAPSASLAPSQASVPPIVSSAAPRSPSVSAAPVVTVASSPPKQVLIPEAPQSKTGPPHQSKVELNSPPVAEVDPTIPW